MPDFGDQPGKIPTSFMVGVVRLGMANQKESAAMKCLRIYATPDGESHFGEVELPTTKRTVHPDAVPFELHGFNTSKKKEEKQLQDEWEENKFIQLRKLQTW